VATPSTIVTAISESSFVATIKVGYRPDGVTVADGLVWVAVAPRRRAAQYSNPVG
jgi:hypothetical protein